MSKRSTSASRTDAPRGEEPRARAADAREMEIDTVLRELLAGRDLLMLSRWPFETARWYELAGSVLRVVGGAETPARSIENALESLTRLGLLDLDDLAAMASDTTGRTETADLMEVVLARSGFGADTAHLAVSAIVDAASFIWEHYGGRIQSMLRRQGEIVLGNVMAELPLASVDDDTKRRIVTHWLQRTLDLPIPVTTRGMRLAAGAHHATVDELVAAADRLDINVAILDELLASYESETTSSPAGGHAGRS